MRAGARRRLCRWPPIPFLGSRSRGCSWRVPRNIWGQRLRTSRHVLSPKDTVGCLRPEPNLLQRQWVTDVSAGLAWVMGTPGGIKLNGALAGFLASVFMQYVAWWARVLALAAPALPSALCCLATTGIFGLSCMSPDLACRHTRAPAARPGTHWVMP
jgi:hypothetical protein